jgi:hypothetical protein
VAGAIVFSPKSTQLFIVIPEAAQRLSGIYFAPAMKVDPGQTLRAFRDDE